MLYPLEIIEHELFGNKRSYKGDFLGKYMDESIGFGFPTREINWLGLIV